MRHGREAVRRRIRGAVALAVALFATAFAYAQSYTAPADAQARAYVGSNACERCHPDEFTSWRRALHVQMTKPIAEARVEGDFSAGTHLEQNGRAYTMETKDGRYTIAVAHDGRPAEKFQVDYTLGARRFQGYLSKLADGRIYVLPVFWHNETKRWLDWKEIAPVPDHPEQDLRQIWNITCVNCHAANGCAAEDLRAAEGRRTPDLRRVRLLPRQQEQRVLRLCARRSLRGLRAAVSNQRADSGERSTGRLLARRPAEPLQPPAGADVDRLLPARRGDVHELPSHARPRQRAHAEGGGRDARWQAHA